MKSNTFVIRRGVRPPSFAFKSRRRQRTNTSPNLAIAPCVTILTILTISGASPSRHPPRGPPRGPPRHPTSRPLLGPTPLTPYDPPLLQEEYAGTDAWASWAILGKIEARHGGEPRLLAGYEQARSALEPSGSRIEPLSVEPLSVELDNGSNAPQVPYCYVYSNPTLPINHDPIAPGIHPTTRVAVLLRHPSY